MIKSFELMRMLVAGMLGLFAISMLAIIPTSYAHTQTTTIPINEELSLEKTITTMTVPEDNELPWGSVHGTIDNPAERYPVIIQFFKGEDLVHVAQSDVKGDDSYEYKFRVRNIVDGEAIDIFEGDYTVKIFKVVKNEINII